MDFRTGVTPWGKPISAQLALGSLNHDVSCDVLVIGSGISGALAAFHLAQAGADVIVIDKRSLSAGSTAVSTALIQYEIDVPMVDLVPRLGLADAQTVYRATRGGLDDLRALIEANGFDCDLTLRPTLYLARDTSDALHLKHEALARAQIGIEAKFIDAHTLRSVHRINRPGAIRSEISLELDPRKLTAQLLQAAVAMGTRIFDQTSLSGDAWSDQSPVLTTADHHSIRASHVVYATGYETPQAFPELLKLCTLQTSYALITHPVDRAVFWPERALLWELGASYFYARTTVDNRIMIGGEDDDVLDAGERDGRLPQKVERLLANLREITGIADVKVDRSWAATFAQTEDGLPFIGSPVGSTRCHFTLGFGGNGILFGLLGAQIIRDAIAGRYNASAKLFGFGRPTSLIAAV